jgi:hypothetical protein
MNWPPYIMRLRIYRENRRISLWVPLFLILSFLLILALILVPILLILALILWFTGWGKLLLMSGPVIFSCLCALRGLEIDVKGGKEQILVSFQ